MSHLSISINIHGASDESSVGTSVVAHNSCCWALHQFHPSSAFVHVSLAESRWYQQGSTKQNCVKNITRAFPAVFLGMTLRLQVLKIFELLLIERERERERVFSSRLFAEVFHKNHALQALLHTRLHNLHRSARKQLLLSTDVKGQATAHAFFLVNCQSLNLLPNPSQDISGPCARRAPPPVPVRIYINNPGERIMEGVGAFI